MVLFFLKSTFQQQLLADYQGTLHSPLNKDDFCQKPNAFVILIHYFVLIKKKIECHGLGMTWRSTCEKEQKSVDLSASDDVPLGPGSAPGPSACLRCGRR